MTEVLIGAIRGSGNAFTPMIITLVTICAFRIVWILVVTSASGKIYGLSS